MSIILAVTTSGENSSAALLRNGTLMEDCSFFGGSHTSTIMPAIDELLNALSLTCRDIDVFAVDVGPGSFTGIRIGVSAVNAMGLVTGKPVVGICSLTALKYLCKGSQSCVCVTDARNNNVYAAIYKGSKVLMPPSAMTIEELAEVIPKTAMCLGTGAVVYKKMLLERLPCLKFPTDYNVYVPPFCVGLAAYDIISSPEFDPSNYKQAEPLYLKPSQAERNKERQ